MIQQHSHTLEITADNQPTVLERLLQVTRYRGFSVVGFSVFPNKNETMLDIKLTVHDDKKPTNEQQNNIRKLSLQLNKLFDINHVNLKSIRLANTEFNNSISGVN